MAQEKTGKKILAVNRKARHDYFVEDTYEAGIALYGTEVKSLRQGGASLKEAWCEISDGEVFVKQMHIAPYDKGNIFNKDPMRPKRLLLHKNEIRKLNANVMQQGYSIVPLKVYLKQGLVKVEIALAKGKKAYDKRDAQAKKDAQREIERMLKG